MHVFFRAFLLGLSALDPPFRLAGYNTAHKVVQLGALQLLTLDVVRLRLGSGEGRLELLCLLLFLVPLFARLSELVNLLRGHRRVEAVQDVLCTDDVQTR